MNDKQRALNRRTFLGLGAGAVGAVGLGAGLDLRAAFAEANDDASQAPQDSVQSGSEPFWGAHQGGILTPAQDHTYIAAFDIDSDQRDDVANLLQTWTNAAAQLCTGAPAQATSGDADDPPADTGEATGLGPAHLTLTFGFGPGLFVKDGVDRFGLQDQRPDALVDLPIFPGDELVDSLTGGDLTVQACANDPQVAFHAIRQLARLASGVAHLRWTQTGSLSASASPGTPRNLLGFKDGSGNPDSTDPAQMDQYVWAGSEGPEWMTGGSYAVIRRIRTTIEHWDSISLRFQESVIGRHKLNGAPLGGQHEFDAADLDASGADGQPVIPLNSHLRLAAAASNGGVKILRRGYNYNDGADVFTERWPPWRQGLEYDVGLIFCAYQQDPRTGFIAIFHNLSLIDALNQFTTHVGSVIVAVPPGAAGPGHWVGEELFG